MNDPNERVAESVARLRQRWGRGLPETAVLLGSGWGGLAARVEGATELSYEELPAFPRLGVGGHAGRLVIGRIGGQPVMVLGGRKHAYETGDATVMKGAIRTLAAAGVRTLVQTNAAGSLNPAIVPGQVMMLADHLNMAQRSPLVGEHGNDRFVDLAGAYDPALRQQAHAVAVALGCPLAEGVYAWMLGPQFETPAEIRMLQRLGADAVGMSTVPEVIVAAHMGVKVAGISCITNLAAGLSKQKLSHAEVSETADRVKDVFSRLLTRFLSNLGKSL